MGEGEGKDAKERRGSRRKERGFPSVLGDSSLCCEVPWGPTRSGHHEVGTMMDILGTGLWGHLSI